MALKALESQEQNSWLSQVSLVIAACLHDNGYIDAGADMYSGDEQIYLMIEGFGEKRGRDWAVNAARAAQKEMIDTARSMQSWHWAVVCSYRALQLGGCDPLKGRPSRKDRRPGLDRRQTWTADSLECL